MSPKNLVLLVAAALVACSSAAPSSPEPIAAPPEPAPAVASPALPPMPHRLLSAGYMHQCCLTAEDRVICNGSNKNDELTVPDTTFTEVSAGLYSTCAIDSSNKPHCWGKYAPPLDANPSVLVERIAAGSKFACAITTARELVCWSNGDFPAPPAGRFDDVVAGWEHACALRDSGEVACFGREQREPIACTDLENADGARCEGKTMVPRSWTAAPDDLRATAIAAGANHTCALTAEGKVTCWGAWGHGDGNTIWSNQLFPPEPLAGNIRKLTAGGGSSCALHGDGTTTCWGDQEDLPGTFVDIDGGASGTCGVREDGAMECFTYSSFAGAALDTTPLRCATR